MNEVIKNGNEFRDDNLSVTRSNDGQKFILNLPGGYVPVSRAGAASLVAVLTRAGAASLVAVLTEALK